MTEIHFGAIDTRSIPALLKSCFLLFLLRHHLGRAEPKSSSKKQQLPCRFALIPTKWKSWLSRSEKLGRGGADDELAKPLITIQWVQVPPD